MYFFNFCNLCDWALFSVCKNFVSVFLQIILVIFLAKYTKKELKIDYTTIWCATKIFAQKNNQKMSRQWKLFLHKISFEPFLTNTKKYVLVNLKIIVVIA